MRKFFYLLMSLMTFVQFPFTASEPAHLKIIAEFITQDGFVHVCPAGDNGKIVLFSSYDKDLSSPIPKKDDVGNVWRDGLWIKRCFSYSKEANKFINLRLEYVPKYSAPVLLSFDWGHSYVFPDVENTARIKKCLPDSATIKWIEEIPGLHNMSIVIWEATELNVWLIELQESLEAKTSKAVVIDKLPPFDLHIFQGIMLADVLRNGKPCLVLYSIVPGGGAPAHNYPTATIISVEKGDLAETERVKHPQYQWDSNSSKK